MSPTFGGGELARRDIRGGCLFVEGGLGFAWGGAGDAMIFGMDPLALVAAVASPAMMARALATATGYLLWYGVNFGFQAGGGITGYVGLLYT